MPGSAWRANGSRRTGRPWWHRGSGCSTPSSGPGYCWGWWCRASSTAGGPEVAAEAVEGGYQLLVTHHPILFRGVKRLTTATPEGRSVLALARAGVAVYSPHTAFDNTRAGINERLAGRLGLTDLKPLRP